jgi:hypothetical protein
MQKQVGMIEENRKNIITPILTYVHYGAIIFFAYLIYEFKFNPFIFGGSLILVPPICALNFWRRTVKPLALELSFGSLFVAELIIINFLSYWEMSGKSVDTIFLIITYLCLYFFVAISLAIVGLPFKKSNSVNGAEQPYYRQIMRTISMPLYFFGLLFAMFSGLMVYFVLLHEPHVVVSCPFLKITYVAVAWIVIALLVTYIYIGKIQDEEIRKYILEKKLNSVNYDVKKIKKYSVACYLLIIFLGSAMETQRGLWVIWIETILLIGLMSLIVWKIYRHAFPGSDREK